MNDSAMEESKHSNADGPGISNDRSQEPLGIVKANIYQAATLNKLLPRGFRIERED